MARKSISPMSPSENEEIQETATVETEETSKIAGFKAQHVNQPVTALNLETGKEETIKISYDRYSPIPVTEKDNKGLSLAEQIEALKSVIDTDEKMRDALLAFVNSESYQTGKELAYASGNYMNQQLRTAVVTQLKNTDRFAEVKASEVFKVWLDGYTAGKPGAKRILDRAQASLNVVNDIDFA